MRDLLVVGGGPAGLATAIQAAQAGLNVTLVERRRFPVDKPCGEGLMPGGARGLLEMGVRVAKSWPFEGIRYVDGNRAVEARFRDGSGLGIRRTVLSQAMVDRASELGVEVLEDSRAREVIEQRDRVRLVLDSGVLESTWLVAADGRGSFLRKRRGASPPGLRRYGTRRHYRSEPWSTFVEVHWSEGAEAYVTPISEDEVGVAFLWHESSPTWESMLARFPALDERLEGLEPTSSVAGAGPMRRRAKPLASRRVAFVGDASGYVDALTGEGVALAFECARALVRSLAEGSLASYGNRHRHATRRYRAVSEVTLILARHPRLRRALIASLEAYPKAFEGLLALSHPKRPNPSSERVS